MNWIIPHYQFSLVIGNPFYFEEECLSLKKYIMKSDTSVWHKNEELSLTLEHDLACWLIFRAFAKWLVPQASWDATIIDPATRQEWRTYQLSLFHHYKYIYWHL